jgi:hypothetical protein
MGVKPQECGFKTRKDAADVQACLAGIPRAACARAMMATRRRDLKTHGNAQSAYQLPASLDERMYPKIGAWSSQSRTIYVLRPQYFAT